LPEPRYFTPSPTDHPDWLPEAESDRLRLVGRSAYGSHYMRRLASGLGIARTTLWQLMRGRGKRVTDLDDRLIELLDAEAEAAAAHGLELAALRKRFLKRRRADA
jgi:hypothetical protein